MGTLSETWARAARALRSRPDPLTSVALTIPVYLIYHLGILLLNVRNGADLVSSLLFKLLHASVSAYVITTLSFALVLAIAVWVQQKRGALAPWAIGRVLAESAVFAVLMLVTVGYATHRITQALADSPAPLSIGAKLVLAAGAGFHEEVVFRALLVSGGSVLIERLLRVSSGVALLAAVVGSSLLFSLAHHFGPLGDHFALGVFIYRALGGLFLATLYLTRGFAVAVYTHALYDALLFFVYP